MKNEPFTLKTIRVDAIFNKCIKDDSCRDAIFNKYNNRRLSALFCIRTYVTLFLDEIDGFSFHTLNLLGHIKWGGFAFE